MDQQLPSMLTKGYVEGVIYNGLIDVDYLMFFTKKSQNTVILGDIEDLNFLQVETDNYYGGKLVAKYLWKLGHRRFALMRGIENNIIMNNRLAGFVDTINMLSSKSCKIDILHADYWQMGAGGKEIEKYWHQTNELPSAVFGLNDHLALNVMIKLKDMGVKVPDKVSIIGFDNVDKGIMVTPHLTTISLPCMEIGKVAAEKMVSLLKGQIKQKHEINLLKPSLIKRSSCKSI